MSETQQEIADIISNVWKANPCLRYGQLLTGLRIQEFANKDTPEASNYNLRDIFYDTDESILKRIKMSNLYLSHIKNV
jgi:hypothetical protein